MLTCKNINKTYKSKKGTGCKAVNDISLDFADSGLVFIIGKSGSGKSTLLNLLSGLDKTDSGEIVIAGKSDKDFSQTDFDVYRNTYVGFVFQDHNVIEDLTVKENIELSLQLQNKETNKEKFEKLIKQMGLYGLENRKSNELSGGQKQRVSIARAIIKEPKIIFADEPTGNLDSGMGTEVFNIFKKISKTKLVIVVTHDLDSALIYGDRIIELNDGKVISDKTKTKDVNLNVIKQEYKTSIDLSFIKTKKIENKESFKFEKIKTSMPIKKLAKISYGNFLSNKIRFIITIFLTILTLTMFGISLNIKTYNSYNASVNSFERLNIKTLAILKNSTDDNGAKVENALISESDIQNVANNSGAVCFKGYKLDINLKKFVNENENDSYSTKLENFIELNETINEKNLALYYDAKLDCGRYPVKNNNCIEILISDYLADSFLFYGIKFDSGDVLPNTDKNYLLGQYFIKNNIYFKIVGIFKTDYKNYDISNNKSTTVAFNKLNSYSSAITVSNALDDYTSQNNCLMMDLYFRQTNQSIDDDYSIIEKSIIADDSYRLQLDTKGYFTENDFCFRDGYSYAKKLSLDEAIISYKLFVLLFNNELDNDAKASFTNVSVEDLIDKALLVGFDDETCKQSKPINVVGIYNDETTTIPQYNDAFIFSNKGNLNAVTSKLISASFLNVAVPENKNEAKLMLKWFDENDYSVYTYTSKELLAFQTMFKYISQILDLATIILLLFVIILIYNFMSVSVDNKKKDIGTLRAMGASGKDIAKIFLIEGAIICAICIVFASILIGIGTVVINTSLSRTFEHTLSIIGFGIWQLLITISVCIFVVFISCIIPIIKLTKMKPVDVIKQI